LLHLDAFSSDAIPTHLLTVQAIEQYLRALKPDGVLLMHLTNRHLALEAPAAAAAERLGASALFQSYRPPEDVHRMVAAPTRVVLIAKSPEALERFADDPRWREARAGGTRPWTDDYTNVVGSLIDGLSSEDVR
jgi:spermidine synthase